MRSMRRLAVVTAFVLCAPAFGGAQEVTLPKGTSVELILQNGLSTTSAKVGDTFRARVGQAIDSDDQPLLPPGTVVMGRVDLVKSPRTGHLTGVIGVKFTHIQLPGAREQSIQGVLTSLRQDDSRPLVELAPRVSTGRMVDTVFISHSSEGRASTLVGELGADDYAHSGLGAPEATVVAGTRITMELTEALTLPAKPPSALGTKVLAIRVTETSASVATKP